MKLRGETMAATFVIACPKCSKQVKVGEEHIGKKVKCKDCQTVYPVQKAGGPPPAPAKKGPPPPPPKPAAKKGPPEPPPAPPVPTPSEFDKKPAYDEDEFSGGSYVLTQTDDSLPRCPFCAKELASAEARICLNCGYDTVKRTRPEVKQVYANTGGETFMYLLPGIAMALLLIGMLVWYLIFWMHIEGWLEDSVFEDEKGPPVTYIAACSPGFFRVYHFLLIAFLYWKLLPFAIKRLIINNKPVEKKIKDD